MKYVRDTYCCVLTACCEYSYALRVKCCTTPPVPGPANGTYSRRDCQEYRKKRRDSTGTLYCTGIRKFWNNEKYRNKTPKFDFLEYRKISRPFTCVFLGRLGHFDVAKIRKSSTEGCYVEQAGSVARSRGAGCRSIELALRNIHPNNKF